MKRHIIILACFLVVQQCWGQGKVSIITMKGDVKIRRGLEETWQQASQNVQLEELDTILTGEGSEAVLALPDGNRFTLGSYSILDISDLRKITERELFLYLMSQKINKINRGKQNPSLRIENITVVRAEKKESDLSSAAKAQVTDQRTWETNGAKALYYHKFYPNAIVKFHRILEKYTDTNSCGELHLYLGRSFEAIDEKGRALDAFEAVLEAQNSDECVATQRSSWSNEASLAIQRLKKQ